MGNIIKEWFAKRAARLSRIKEIKDEINKISEMQRINAGVVRCSINSGRFPIEPRLEPKYWDYATARKAVLKLEDELNALKA